MKKRLLLEYIIAYILLGVLGFFTITYVGSVLIENYLEGIVSRNLNLEAESIAGNYHLLHYWETGYYDLLEEDLKTIANYEDASIWIVSEDETLDVAIPETEIKAFPKKFSPSAWKKGDHSIGKFYGYFDDDRLTVLSPITAKGLNKSGYIILHYQMERLYIRRSGALMITQILFVLMYLFSFILVALFYFRIHKPLQDIAEGASAYASGDLSYRIPVDSNNEIGYVARTLNYMSEVLNQNGKYQKEFVSNVSHDFRSPLTSIKGYVDAILDGTIPPEYHEKYLGIIASETERLEQLTKTLLALNELDIKKRTLEKIRFDIHAIIHSASEAFEGRCLERDIHLRLNLDGSELYVLADEQQIQQVLYNLLDNAIKFSPDHSSICIETKKKNGKVFVSVEDHGCGIPKESLSKIWTRFYKTDTSRGKDRKGTGLGLSIVKEIINAHNQQIDVISTEGAGTEFIFTLEKA